MLITLGALLLIIAILIVVLFYFLRNTTRRQIKQLVREWKAGLKEYQETEDFNTLYELKMDSGVCYYINRVHPKWDREWINTTKKLLESRAWWIDTPNMAYNFEENEKLIKQRIQIMEDILSGKIKTLKIN